MEVYGFDRVEILKAVCEFLCKQPETARVSVMTITVGDFGRPQITATFSD